MLQRCAKDDMEAGGGIQTDESITDARRGSILASERGVS